MTEGITIGWPTLLALPGGLLVLGSLAPNDKTRLTIFVTGLAMLAGSIALDNRELTPTPQPTPGPQPVVTTFGEGVIRSFDGTKAEAQVLSALSKQFADQLGYDGQRQPPRVTDSRVLGQLWQAAQQWQALGSSPWGGRFPAVASLAAAELQRRGIIDSAKTVAMTPVLRAEAVRFWQELAEAFAQSGKG